jgi:hypothetical protein
VERDTGTGLLRMGSGFPWLSMVGGICGWPIVARRHVVEGIEARRDGD